MTVNKTATTDPLTDMYSGCITVVQVCYFAKAAGLQQSLQDLTDATPFVYHCPLYHSPLVLSTPGP